MGIPERRRLLFFVSHFAILGCLSAKLGPSSGWASSNSTRRTTSLAAQRLGIAQARASATLGKLRRYFDDALFVRTSRGMEPTPYAEGLFPDVLKCFERLSTPKGERHTFSAETTTRQFRICMTDISEIIVLPKLVNELRRLAPGVGVEAERITAESPSAWNRVKSI